MVTYFPYINWTFYFNLLTVQEAYFDVNEAVVSFSPSACVWFIPGVEQ